MNKIKRQKGKQIRKARKQCRLIYTKEIDFQEFPSKERILVIQNPVSDYNWFYQKYIDSLNKIYKEHFDIEDKNEQK